MLLYYLFWMFMGFIKHFYIIFGTNLLTQSPVPVYVFFPCFSVSKKRNIKRSRNGMKPSGEVIFGKKATRETWSPRQGSNKEGMRQGGVPTPLGHTSLPRGFLVCFLTSTPSLLDCVCSKNNSPEGFIPFGLRLILLFCETLK